jgi:hypothetical protein
VSAPAALFSRAAPSTAKAEEDAMSEERSGRVAEAVREFGPDGSLVETREAALAAAAPAATTTACLELRNGAGVDWTIQVTVNPNTYPFLVTSGTIKGTICGSPWTVTGGSLDNALRIDARRAGPGSCASTVTIVGQFQNPSSWRGTYGFDGSSTSFTHTTLFKGWSACP